MIIDVVQYGLQAIISLVGSFIMISYLFEKNRTKYREVVILRLIFFGFFFVLGLAFLTKAICS